MSYRQNGDRIDIKEVKPIAVENWLNEMAVAQARDTRRKVS